jgi:hypothetical protein
MRLFLCLCLCLLVATVASRAQTADDVTKAIDRLVHLDSIDLAQGVKFRAGLEPALHAADADEAGMAVLADPYAVHGQGKPGAAGWYRVSFVAPERIGKFALPKNGYNLGVETNVLGAWEAYTYVNGKPAGAEMATGVRGVVSAGNVISAANQPPTAWASNAPMPTKPGDKVTVAILATAWPLGRGSPDGFGLRHLRLRFALAHTGARQPFYAAMHEARERLAKLQGAELAALREKLKGPLARLDALDAAAETGKLDELTKAMAAATKELNEALKKK